MTSLKCVLPILCMLISLITSYGQNLIDRENQPSSIRVQNFTNIKLKLGDKCGPNLEGTCLLVTNCETAKKALMGRRQHGLERCGFSQNTEIVCCLDKFSDTRGPTIRKSLLACNNYHRTDELVIHTFIIGGENASLGEFPHMAALGYPDDNSSDHSWDCGGSLISDTYILTAAHCLIRNDRKEPAVIRLGKVDLFGDTDGVEAQDVAVAGIVVHPDYNIRDKLNDIGLVRLAKPAQMSDNVKPVCLYQQNDDPKRLEVCGWGLVTNTGGTYRFLQKTALQPVDIKECNTTLTREVLSKPVFETQLCAMSNDSTPRDTCQGDSGGPIQYITQKVEGDPSTNTFFLVGVTSYGRGCAGSLPSVYTRVARFLDWIEENVWPLT